MLSQTEHLLSDVVVPKSHDSSNIQCDQEGVTEIAEREICDENVRARGNSALQIITSAYEEEEDNYTFICHVNNACNETNVGLFLLIASLLLSIFAFVIGTLRGYDCPCNPSIPAYLIAEGLVLFLKNALQAARMICRLQPDPGERHCVYTLTDITSLFLVLWNMPGGVWVMGVFDTVQTHDHELPTYCDITVYWYSFTLVLLTILVVVFKLFFYGILWITHDRMEASGKFQKIEKKVFDYHF